MKNILVTALVLFPFFGSAQKSNTKYAPLVAYQYNSMFIPTLDTTYECYSIKIKDKNDVLLKPRTGDNIVGTYLIRDGKFIINTSTGTQIIFNYRKLDTNSFSLEAGGKTVYYFEIKR
jgi:hypothetical protein